MISSSFPFRTPLPWTKLFCSFC